jgi:uncharacterized membrane protein
MIRFATAIAAIASGIGRWIGRHWLALMILSVGLFLGLAVAAPILAMLGYDRLSGAIYLAYRVTCHQLPHRSWFIGGQSFAYDWPIVEAYLGPGTRGIIDAFHNPIRDASLGYQFALCQRDTAIFGGLMLTAMVFGFVRSRRAVPALPFKLYVLALVPIAVDGLTQLFGLRDSNPALRTATGLLFGAATALLVRWRGRRPRDPACRRRATPRRRGSATTGTS